MSRRSLVVILGRTVFAAVCSPAVWVPAAVLVVLTLVFRLSSADTLLAQSFYAGIDAGNRLSDRWPMMTVWPWMVLYDWGVYPGWILGGGGLVVWIASFFWTRLASWRDPGLFCALVLIVGPGILVNGLLKPYWQRPRPCTTILFGGEQEFVPVFQRGQGTDDYSFPSGHAAMGFYLLTPAFVLYRSRRCLARAFFLLGLVAGGTIGLARIVCGGHFASDVLWAFGVVYFTALVLALPFRFGNSTLRPNCSDATR